MQTEDPNFIVFVKFLDGARFVPSVQHQKRLIFEMLALQPGEKVLDIGLSALAAVAAELDHAAPDQIRLAQSNGQRS